MGKFTKNNFLNTFNKIKEFFRHGDLQGYIKAIETMQLVSIRQYRCGAVRLFQPTQFKFEREIELLKGADNGNTKETIKR